VAPPRWPDWTAPEGESRGHYKDLRWGESRASAGLEPATVPDGQRTTSVSGSPSLVPAAAQPLKRPCRPSGTLRPVPHLNLAQLYKRGRRVLRPGQELEQRVVPQQLQPVLPVVRVEASASDKLEQRHIRSTSFPLHLRHFSRDCLGGGSAAACLKNGLVALDASSGPTGVFVRGSVCWRGKVRPHGRPVKGGNLGLVAGRPPEYTRRWQGLRQEPQRGSRPRLASTPRVPLDLAAFFLRRRQQRGPLR
jgi:hypothetical protein